MKIEKIGVTGLGYVGLPLAAAFAGTGVKAAGMEIVLLYDGRETRGGAETRK